MDDLNPYASPAIIAEPANKRSDKLFASRGCWRQDRYVVTTLHGILPSRCVKTGEPAVRHEVIRMTWYPPWAVASILLGPLFFVPLIFVGRSINLSVPTGRAWERRKSRNAFIVVGLLVTGVALGVLACGGLLPAVVAEICFFLGIFLFVVGIIVANRAFAQPLKVQHANTQFVWLSGAGEPFLEQLPLWPGK
jgi:hypothetical protein